MTGALAGFVMGGVFGCEVGCIIGYVEDGVSIGRACEETTLPCTAIGAIVGMKVGTVAVDHRKMQLHLKEQRTND